MDGNNGFRNSKPRNKSQKPQQLPTYPQKKPQFCTEVLISNTQCKVREKGGMCGRWANLLLGILQPKTKLCKQKQNSATLMR